MNKREVYTNCMKPHMTGGGPGRKERFCVGAKLCSGKASNEAEAKKLCAEAALNPKPPRARRSNKCFITPETVSCIIKNLSPGKPLVYAEITPLNLKAAIANCTEGL